MVIIRNAKDVIEHYVNCKAGDCRKCPLVSAVHFPKRYSDASTVSREEIDASIPSAISVCEIITATINRISKEINGMTQS